MVKYYEVEGRIVKLANDKVTATFNCYISVDRFTIIEEDGIFDGKEVHEGDLIITLYDIDENKNRKYMIVDKDNQFAIKAQQIREQQLKQREECNEACPNCEACDCKGV